MYHSIDDNKEFFTVKRADFERQMAYLAKEKYKVISILELISKLKAQQKIEPKTVVLTFDDGYRDNYMQAFPVLKKYNFPAAIFVVTGLIGGVSVNRNDTRFQMLNWQEIREMAESGLITFWPHTENHKKMTFLAEGGAELEISKSKASLDSFFNKNLNILAYPFGRYNQSVIDACKKSGIEAAFTVETGRVNLGDNMLELKRNSIDSQVSFAMFKGIVKRGRL